MTDSTSTKKFIFPLFERAEELGVLKGESGWLISAPTATGKSYLGLEIIKRNLANKPALETYLYIVPFKALAEEIYNKLKNELPSTVNLNIKTGDYDKQFDLSQTDVLIATYESIDGIIQTEKQFHPSIVIADEFSIIGDSTRGARIESLIAYLAKMNSSAILFVLSAVLDNPQRIAQWLDLQLLEGTAKDRQVKLSRVCVLYSKGRKNEVVEKIVKRDLQHGNIIIFCGTKDVAESQATQLKEIVSKVMRVEDKKNAQHIASQLKQEFPYLVGLQDLISDGVAYHHAGLEVDLRKAISDSFRERKIRIICATPTLSAGVNLPARTVIVKDLKHGRERATVAELVNMLGRAGRPGLDNYGVGYFLFERDLSSVPKAKSFISKVKKGDVEKLESQIGKSMTNALYFVLSTAARFKGIARDDLIAVYNTTLWGYENPLQPPLPTAREAARQIEGSIQAPTTFVQIVKESISVHGGCLKARGGSRSYNISLEETECTCSCPDFRLRHNRSCKHIKQLRYEAVFGEIGKIKPEARTIALQSIQSSGIANNPMYMLAASVELLLSWNFLIEKGQKLVATSDGLQALSNFLLDMSHVRLLRDRIANYNEASNEEDIIGWAIEDYRNRGAPEDSTKSDLSSELAHAIFNHINDGPYKEILPQKQIQKFLDVKDRMDQIFRSYLAFCPKSNKQLKSFIKTARRRLHHGCRTGLLPLMILNLPGINEASKARLLYENGVKDVINLSQAHTPKLAQLLKTSEDDAKTTIDRAQSITQLVQNFQPSQDMTALNMLAVRTEIKVDDLVDYILPNYKYESIP